MREANCSDRVRARGIEKPIARQENPPSTRTCRIADIYCENAPNRSVVEAAGMVFSARMKVEAERHAAFYVRCHDRGDTYHALAAFDETPSRPIDDFGNPLNASLKDGAAYRCRLCGGWMRSRDLGEFTLPLAKEKK